MELYVLRHGTTEWNRLQRLQGQTDIPLDEEGVRLAKETGEALEYTNFDVCYSSPLKRAVATAQYVIGDRDIPIIEDYRLQEVNFGDWEGRDCSKNTKEIPQDAMLHFFDMKGDRRKGAPNGECLQELLDRTKEFYDEIVRDPENENKRILLSMHGASGRALMHNVWGGESFWVDHVPANCAISIVRFRDGIVRDYKKDCILYGENIHDYYAG